MLSNEINMSAIRLLRLLRLTTIVRRIGSMRRVVGVLFKSLKQVRHT